MLEKIKSIHIFKKILKCLDECKVLKLINYNKRLQKKIKYINYQLYKNI